MSRNIEKLPPDACDVLVGNIAGDVLVRAVKECGPVVAVDVFQGFRANSSSVKNPIVRQRLVTKAESDAGFRELLVNAWCAAHTELLEGLAEITVNTVLTAMPDFAARYGGANVFLSFLLDVRKSLNKAAIEHRDELLACGPAATLEPPVTQTARKEPPRETGEDRRLKEAREKVTSLQKDVRRLASDLQSTLNARNGAAARADRLQGEVEAAQRAGSSAQQKLERAQRELARAREESAQLRKAVKDLRKALDAKPGADQARREAQDVPWQSAALRLIKAKKIDAAAVFLEALADVSGEDARPHELLLRVYGAGKRVEEHRRELLWLGRNSLQAGDLASALDRLSRVAAGDPKASEARALLAAAVSRVDPRNERRMSEIRRVVRRLRQNAPSAFSAVAAAAAKVSPALVEALHKVQAEDDLDATFRLSSGADIDMTPNEMIRAVNRNDLGAVKSLRSAIRKTRQERRDAVETLKRMVEDVDPSCWVALTAETEAVVVDASNVANFGLRRGERARLANILAIRRELRRKRFFPVHIVADANLPHKIDDSAALKRMDEAGEIEFVQPRTDADEVIIQVAQRLRCAVVTRDAMLDWDPDGTVHKIRFDIDRNAAEIMDVEW